MNIQTSKSELIQIIMDIDNIETIEYLKKILKPNRSDFWNDLSLIEKKEISKGIHQLNQNQRISFDDYIKKIS